jgi:hypothetical protein
LAFGPTKWKTTISSTRALRQLDSWRKEDNDLGWLHLCLFSQLHERNYLVFRRLLFVRHWYGRKHAKSTNPYQENEEWKEVEIGGEGPSPRSRFATCLVSENQIMFLGGKVAGGTQGFTEIYVLDTRMQINFCSHSIHSKHEIFNAQNLG